VAELLDLGLVECWEDHPGGPALMLSSTAARTLGLESLDSGRGLLWRPAGSPPKERTRTSREVSETDLGGTESGRNLDKVPVTVKRDPAEMAGPGEIPWPSVVIDPGALWPTAVPPPGPCPVCLGRKLKRSEACVYCDRTGVDYLIPVRAKGDRRKPVMAGRKRLFRTLRDLRPPARVGTLVSPRFRGHLLPGLALIHANCGRTIF
jgi:hypothetical protein